MLKRLLLATSVLALTAGSAFAQSSYTSPGQSPAMPPPPSTMSGPGASGTSGSSGTGTMGQAPKSGSMTHSATHAAMSGHSASRVKEAQQALKQDGLYKGKVDGKIGPQTKSALAQFQKQNGLKQTAQLDHATMKALTQGGGSSGAGSMGSTPMPGGGSGMPAGGSSGGGGSQGGMPNGGSTSQ